MIINIDLNTTPVVQDGIKAAIAKVHQLAVDAGYQSVPLGFNIDSTYCDWHDISTAELVDIIDSTCGNFGPVTSDVYQSVCEFICEQVSDLYAKLSGVIVVRKLYANTNGSLTYLVPEQQWQECLSLYEDNETVINQLIHQLQAKLVDFPCTPDITINIDQ
ncbi:hypothetical protein HNW13_018590 [Shewanella sp. BF02_Schw]|uniref:hypothetical protein n=1 Tax=Shewanella sp. BF02_Schw TaxID=394908 RepID=UPI001786D750|nr:hypothetical protein [Shewanella sp. BF02_Schw]MBO1897750.1 hypothetical protein [Shewanella sp. BF02_Schw]